MDSDGADRMSVDSGSSMEDNTAGFFQLQSQKDKTPGEDNAAHKAELVSPHEAQNRDQMSQHLKNIPIGKHQRKHSHPEPGGQSQIESANYSVTGRTPPSTNQVISNLAGREGLRKPIGGQYEGSLSDSQNHMAGSLSTRRAKDEPLRDGPTRRALGSANQEERGDQDVGLGAPCHTSAQPIFKQQDIGSLWKELTEKFRNIESERDQLRAQNEHLREQHAIIDRRYTSLQSESMTHQYQNLESYMKDQFKGLINGIKTWVLRRVPSSTISSNLREKLEEDDDKMRYLYLEAIAPQTGSINELLNLIYTDRKVCMYLLRGMIFRILLDSVFNGAENERLDSEQDSPHPWLPSKVGESLQVLMRELQNRGHAPEVFHRWRSTTMALLGPAPTDIHSNKASFPQFLPTFVENEADHIFRMVAPLLGDEGEQNETFISVAKSDLQNLVKKAVELSLLICHQRALWTLQFHSRETTFDPRSMQVIGDLEDDHAPGDSPRRTVEILISPALCKQGSMDGEDYENLYVVEKAEVWTR